MFTVVGGSDDSSDLLGILSVSFAGDAIGISMG